MPLGALILAKVLWLDEPLGVGLLLLGCAAGAPFLPKLAQLSRGNLPFAVGAMVLLMIITVGYLPIVLPLLLPEVTVNPAKIAQSLIVLMLLPLGVGLFVKACHREIICARQTLPRSALQHQPRTADPAHLDRQFRQGASGVRNARHSRGTIVHRVRMLDGMVARRSWGRYATGAGAWNRATQYRRSPRGRKSELHRCSLATPSSSAHSTARWLELAPSCPFSDAYDWTEERGIDHQARNTHVHP